MLPNFTLAHLPAQRANANFSPVLATFYPAFGKSGTDAAKGAGSVPKASGEWSVLPGDVLNPNCDSCHRSWLA